MNSIQRRLTIQLSVLCISLWAVGSLAVYFIVRAGLMHELDFALKADIAALVNMTEQTGRGLKFDSAGELMPAFERDDRPNYFELWEPDGSVLYRSPAFAFDEQHLLPRQTGTLSSPRFWDVILPDGRRGRAIGIRFVPKPDEDEPPAPGASLDKETTLVMAVHRDEFDRRLAYLASVLFLVGSIMAAASALVVRSSVRRGLRLMSILAERAASIDASSLQLRFPVENLPDELKPIAQRLNDLVARLENSFARERRFTADVAHELRTPIAELRALSEVALKWPDDPACARNALQDALSIALQMESIATGSMALARCDANLFDARPERVSMPALVQDVLRPLEAKARNKNLEIVLDVPRDTCWFVDPTALRSIVTNLITNAVDYSPPSQTIRVQVGKNGTGDELSILNRNENLLPEDVPHLFERFWRKDSARSDSSHSGLGLAVAHAYARLLRMKLNAELNHSEIRFVLSGAQLCQTS